MNTYKLKHRTINAGDYRIIKYVDDTNSSCPQIVIVAVDERLFYVYEWDSRDISIYEVNEGFSEFVAALPYNSNDNTNSIVDVAGVIKQHMERNLSA